MAADGRIVIDTKIEKQNVDQELRQLKREISTMTKELQLANMQGMMPFQKQLLETQKKMYGLAMSMHEFSGTNAEFMAQVQQLGKEYKKANDALLNANNLAKVSLIQTAGQMMNMTTQAKRISDNYDRMGNALYKVNKAGLAVADRMNQIANNGNAAVLALRMLGPTASMKELVDMQRMINQGIMRFQMVALAAAVSSTILYGGLHEAAKKANAEYAKSFEQMIAALKKAFEPMVEVFAEVMTHVYKFITVIANMIIKFNEAHPVLSKMIQGFLMLIPALTLILSPLAIGIGLFNGMLAAWNSIWMLIGPLVTGLAAMSATVWIVAGAIVGLVTVGVLLYKNWDQVKAFLLQTWETIKSAALSIWDGIKAGLAATWEGIKTVAMTVWEGIKAYFTTMLSIYVTIFSAVWEGVTTVLTTIWEAIKTIATTVWEGIKTFFSTVLNGIKTTFSAVWDTIKGALETVWNTLKSTAETVWNGVKTFFETTLNTIKNTFTAVWNTARDTVIGVWNTLKTKAQEIFNTLATFFSNTWNNVKNTAVNIWNAIKGSISNIVSNLSSAVQSTFNGLKSAVSSIFSGVKDTLINLWEGIKNTAKSWASSFVDIGRDLLRGIWDGISNMADWLWNKVKGMLNGLTNKIKDFFGIHSPSRLFAEYGGYLSEGLAIGITADSKLAENSMIDLAKRVSVVGESLGKLVSGSFEMSVIPQINPSFLGANPSNAPMRDNEPDSFTIVVQNMTVRSDEDILRISRELYNLQRQSRRSRGERG
ncbi:phage tail protein [Geobacillus icigianus]|uniref:Phage tail tape measure protein n=1 Tax=Geobacillus subterraneus TaxID=129338 RepID=A0A679FL25_9BACL|nr:hypothetical protein [Geobacillus subterraneus]BBW97222.1 hypothetical protein GsuE55_20550 [Geobacillus subterraneus]